MLVLNNLTASQASTYCVVVSGICGPRVTNCATLTIENRPPVARDDAYSTPEDMTLVITAPGILANDSDPDGDAVSALLVTGPANGSVALSVNGSFIYVPNADYNGLDSFTYRASDGSLNSDVATVTITITPVNDPPTVTIVSPTNGSVYIASAHFSVIADANDIDGVVTNVQIFSGTNLIGTFTNAPYFVPQTNLPSGTYTYYATATDNDGLRATSSVVSITVTSGPPVTAVGPIFLSRDTGLFHQLVRVSNPTPNDFVNGVRVFVDVDPPFEAPDRVWNATGTNASGVAFVDSRTPVPSGSNVIVLIQYYVTFPRVVPTSITLSAEPLEFSAPAIPQPKVMSVLPGPGGAVIEFTTDKHCTYYLQYSDDLVRWTTLPGLRQGDGNPARTQDPGSLPCRFYRVIVVR
jgi:hypothetical protein